MHGKIRKNLIKNICIKKEKFYSNSNIEHIIVKNSQYSKRIWKIFRIKNVGEYHNLYLSDSLTNVFETLAIKLIGINKLSLAFFFQQKGLTLQSALKS